MLTKVYTPYTSQFTQSSFVNQETWEKVESISKNQLSRIRSWCAPEIE